MSMERGESGTPETDHEGSFVVFVYCYSGSMVMGVMLLCLALVGYRQCMLYCEGGPLRVWDLWLGSCYIVLVRILAVSNCM